MLENGLDVESILAEAEKLAVQAKYEQADMVNVDNTSLGSKVSQWFELKKQSDKITEYAKEIKGYQESLENQIIDEMRTEDMVKISTKDGTFTLSPKSMPSVSDMYVFIKWVAEDIDNRIGFLPKKVNDKAVNEMLEEQGLLPPGVNTYLKDKLNKRKAK